MTIEERLRAALAERKAKLDLCPANKRSLGGKPCPRCSATTAGPCWIGVEADAALVDAVKEIVA
jgi:hypothetical protein